LIIVLYTYSSYSKYLKIRRGRYASSAITIDVTNGEEQRKKASFGLYIIKNFDTYKKTN